jgi:agmatine deiminase
LNPDLPPTAQGYRMPAEWAPHQGTWLSWPHNRDTWPSLLVEAEATMAQAVRALAPHETVFINVLEGPHEQHVRALLDEAGVRGSVVFHRLPTNDAWIRDHGAILVTRDRDGHRERAALRWIYNCWGEKYPPFEADQQVAFRMAELLSLPVYEPGMVLEGGSIEVNGAGLLLTTEACLLHPNRNPTRTRVQIEDTLKASLGVTDILWLGDGIAGDDTDGHIDDLARFVDPRTVLTIVEADPHDDNYLVLQENLERLHTLADAYHLTVQTLPMPRPVLIEGVRLPATYANFYIANRTVLLPVFGDPHDEVACRIVQACFPDRTVVPLDARPLVWGLGAFHCLTQQVPW